MEGNTMSYVSRFQASLRGDSPRTAIGYGHDIKHFIDFVGGEGLIKSKSDELENILSDYLNFLYDRGLQTRSILRIFTSIKRFYRFFEDEIAEGAHIERVFRRLRLPKRPKTIPYHLTETDIATVMSYLDGLDITRRTIIRTIYATGIRNSEMRSVKISDVDTAECTIMVRHGKGNKDRITPYPSSISDEIKRYLAYRKSISARNDYLFLNKNRTQVSMGSLIHWCANVSKDTGIRVRPHALRHSIATHLYERGKDLLAVRELLGHEDISTTQVYTHCAKAVLAESINRYHPMAAAEK